LADMAVPNVDSPVAHARPSWSPDDPRAYRGDPRGRQFGRSGFGLLRRGAVGGLARESNPPARRPPRRLALKLYRALFLVTLGSIGFAIFWLILHFGSR